MVMKSNMIIGPSQSPVGQGGKQERLTLIKLTDAEVSRVCDVFAMGPLTRKPIDDGLIEAGIFEQYDDMDAVITTGKGWGNPDNFYRPSGAVREYIMESAKLPTTDTEKMHCLLGENNDQKILIQELQNAITKLMTGDSDARHYAEKVMKRWV